MLRVWQNVQSIYCDNYLPQNCSGQGLLFKYKNAHPLAVRYINAFPAASIQNKDINIDNLDKIIESISYLLPSWPQGSLMKPKIESQATGWGDPMEQAHVLVQPSAKLMRQFQMYHLAGSTILVMIGRSKIYYPGLADVSLRG